MNDDTPTETLDIKIVRDNVLKRFPLLGVALSHLKDEATSKISTSATNGEKILYNPEFMARLNDDERLFVYAHEVMHVAFNHIMRSKDKLPKQWNIATDAVINQILKKEGLPILNGGINMPEASNKSADEVYDELINQEKNKENKDEKNKKNNQSQQNNNEQKQSSSSENSQDQRQEKQEHESHGMWQESIDRKNKKEQEAKQSQEKTNKLINKIKQIFRRIHFQKMKKSNAKFQKKIFQMKMRVYIKKILKITNKK